jgi:hypothetical protein
MSHEEYRSEREERCNQLHERLQAGRQATYEQQDKAVLTLSSAALALSTSFLKDLVPLPKASLIAFLIGSWIAFSGAILSTMFSYYLSQRAHDQQLANLENYRGGHDDALDDQHNPFRIWTERFNRASLCCFAIGLLATTIFVGVNTLHLARMGDKKITLPPEKKGITPATLPKQQNRPAEAPAPPPQQPKK